MRFHFLFYFVALLVAAGARAAKPGDPAIPRFAELRFGFAQAKNSIGPHLGGTYGYEINPRFFLGIDSGFRRLSVSGGPDLSVLSYGLLLRHRVLESDLPHSGFFLQYGLLFRMIFEENTPGYGYAHETELAALWALEIPVFFKLSYSISKLRYFAQTPRPLSGFDGVVGYAWRW